MSTMIEQLLKQTARRMLKDARLNPVVFVCAHRPRHDMSFLDEGLRHYNQAIVDFWKART